MAKKQIKQKLSEDVVNWEADGLIDSETAGLLRERYEVPGFGFVQFIKYLGIIGGAWFGLGLLGMVSAIIESEVFVILLLAAISAGFFILGFKMNNDSLSRYPYTSKVVLFLAVAFFLSAICVLLALLDFGGLEIFFFAGLLALPLIFFLAYRYLNIFLLILGLLLFFHWVGSWHSMFGRSTYGVNIQDPRFMCFISLLVVIIGIFHERLLREKTIRFFLAYEAVSLVYLNLSLLILSIYPPGEGQQLIYILVLAFISIGEIVVGAFLKNGLFMGFGVTFLAINMFTRYHEVFWDRLDKGLFFLMGGVLLFGCSVIIELVLKKSRQEKKA